MVRKSLVSGVNLFVAVLVAVLLIFTQTQAIIAQADDGTQKDDAAQQNDKPVTCLIGIYLMSLTNFNFANSLFDADSYIWSNCPPETHTPIAKADFINAQAASVTELDSWDSDGVAVESGKLDGSFRHKWDLRSFPFDRHTLEIVIEPDEGNITSLIFAPDVTNSGYHSDLQLNGWQLTGLRFEVSESPYRTNFGEPAASKTTLTFTRLRVLMDIERTERFSFFTLTAPVYITFLVTLLSFLLYVTGVNVLATQFSILSGGLFATIISMNSSRAALGNDLKLTLLDQIHIVVLLYILVELGLAIYSQLALKRGWTEEAVTRLNYRFLTIASLSFVVINALLIGLARYIG